MRKVLSFVLVLSLVLGSFSMAFAADTTAPKSLTDIAGTANEDAIQVNFDLGIVTGNPDGTFLPEKGVNRAEFAAMITRTLAIPESALTGYTATKFKDMSGYGWATSYIAFCESKGIMLGDGNGNVMPGRNVNTNEAMTMVLRAVGYTANSSELTGVWPANYISLAQNVGLYDEVANTVNVDKANAAQIVYNALTVQKVSVNTDGKTDPLTVKDNSPNAAASAKVAATLLTTGLNCYEVNRVISDNEDSIINVNKYLGQNGSIFANKDNEIVAFIADSTALTGTFNDDFTKFTTTIGEVDYTSSAATTTAGVTNFVNGKAGASGLSMTDKLTLNVKLSGKKITDVYSILDWKIKDAKVVTSDDLKDITGNKSLLSGKFVKDDDKNIDTNSFALVGVSSLDKIAAGNVVYVYTNSDGISKVEVGTEVATGTVQNYKSGDPDKFNIGTKTYKNAQEMVNEASGYGNAITDENVGDDVKASLDANGFVFDFEATDGGAKNIAVVEKFDTGIDDQVRIFTAAGKSEVHTYDKAKLTPNSATNVAIGYGLNKDGKITSTNVENSGANVDLKFKSNSVVTVVDKDKVITSDVVVFVDKGDEFGLGLSTLFRTKFIRLYS